MAESHGWTDPLEYEPYDGVEAMIRAAGQYVRATDDLRPRVLEAARLQHSERWAKRRITQVAVLTIVLALFTAADKRGEVLGPSRRANILIASGFDERLPSTFARAPRSGDGDWRMIDAFTELRRQQAQVLRFAL